MLRTNLSTRPFYNERAVHVALGAAAALVVALTVLNVVRLVTLSRHNTELATQVNREHAEADRLTREAENVRRAINQSELKRIVAAADEANSLIDQRTFSWTAFFNHIEATMPPDVMLTAVHPSVRGGVTRLTMGTVGRRAEDIDEFMERLEATGAFENALPVREDTNEQGLYRVTITADYLPHLAEDPSAEPEATAKPGTTTKPEATTKPGGQR